MGAVCRAYGWPRRTLYGIAALPLILGAFEQELPVPVRERTIEHARLVNAPAARIWSEIENPRDIVAAEVEGAWVYRIGVPLPKARPDRAHRRGNRSPHHHGKAASGSTRSRSTGSRAATCGGRTGSRPIRFRRTRWTTT
jgi:hypothetical protein